MVQADGVLRARRDGRLASEKSAAYFDELVKRFDAPRFPCIGAGASVKRAALCMGLFDSLGNPASWLPIWPCSARISWRASTSS